PRKIAQKGPQSHVEMGVGTDSLLRLDENSAAILESADKTDVAVRIESGSALLDVSKIDKPNRIRVAMAGIRTVIDSKGVFQFSKTGVSVLDGKLKIDGASFTVQKGW